MSLPESATPVDYLLVGHLTRDLDASDTPSLGGTVAYAGLTARALGWHPALVTSYGEAIDLTPLAGVPLHRVAARETTTFRNQTSEGAREQHLLARSADIDLEAIPRAWRSASVVHLAPVADEVDPALTGAFHETALVGITLQGWVRSWDASGRVGYASWEPRREAILRAGAVVASLEDFGGDEAEVEHLAAACRLLVITEGAHGARVYWNGDVRRFPVAPADEVDSTGAGDIFAAALLIRYHHTRDPWEAARFANLLAAASVTRRGLAGVPTPQQAEQAAAVWVR